MLQFCARSATPILSRWNSKHNQIAMVASSFHRSAVNQQGEPDLNKQSSTTTDEIVKPYDQIPGTEISALQNMIFILRNLKYVTQKAHHAFRDMFALLGPIVRNKFAGLDMIIISSPKDIERLFRAEGKYPKRFDIMPWLVYRQQKNLPLGVLLA